MVAIYLAVSKPRGLMLLFVVVRLIVNYYYHSLIQIDLCLCEGRSGALKWIGSNLTGTALERLPCTRERDRVMMGALHGDAGEQQHNTH